MKSLVIIFSMVAFIAFSGYSQSADIKGLLEKPETRTEIFNAIFNNHELMTEFMKNMKGNEHAMMMMEEDSKMMGHDGKMEMKEDHQMMDHAKMMEMCAQDSAMCCNMANMMTENPEMKHKKDDNKQEHKH